MFLLGEISTVRADEKSAEAIVAMTPAERQEQRRAEESRKNRSHDLVRTAHRSLKRPGVVIMITTAAAAQE